MCGIAGGYAGCVEAGVEALAHRGPDARGEVALGPLRLGHTRLAVLDPDARSDQPMSRGRTAVSYNGEAWNYRAMRRELEALGRRFSTGGDTEVIATALDEWGAAALPRIDGMFAVAWARDDGSEAWLARDRFGEVPLHYGMARGGWAFASEVKALLAMGAAPGSIRPVPPAGLVRLRPDGTACARAYEDLDVSPLPDGLDRSAPEMLRLLGDACRERSIADVPAATLLSGGIDSSAIAAFLMPHVPGLVAYTAVHDPKARDLRLARLVAASLGLELREVPIPAPTPDGLSGVVRAIEMPHKAQVEIAWACLHLARALRADGIKVVFSGEGSDELWASYGNSYFGVRDHPGGWHGFRRDSFLGQHRKNFPRANKVFMAHSVECRLPFLHTELARYALRLSRAAVVGPPPSDPSARPSEKRILKDALAGLLPEEVLRRPKEAFQVGAGLDAACARAVADPRKFYACEYRKHFPGVAP